MRKFTLYYAGLQIFVYRSCVCMLWRSDICDVQSVVTHSLGTGASQCIYHITTPKNLRIHVVFHLDGYEINKN